MGRGGGWVCGLQWTAGIVYGLWWVAMMVCESWWLLGSWVVGRLATLSLQSVDLSGQWQWIGVCRFGCVCLDLICCEIKKFFFILLFKMISWHFQVGN